MGLGKNHNNTTVTYREMLQILSGYYGTKLIWDKITMGQNFSKTFASKVKKTELAEIL